MKALTTFEADLLKAQIQFSEIKENWKCTIKYFEIINQKYKNLIDKCKHNLNISKS